MSDQCDDTLDALARRLEQTIRANAATLDRLTQPPEYTECGVRIDVEDAAATADTVEREVDEK